MFFFQTIDASHLGVGAVSGAFAVAAAEGIRWWFRKQTKKFRDEEKVILQCKAEQAAKSLAEDRKEDRELLMSIRDGVRDLCTIARSRQSPMGNDYY